MIDENNKIRSASEIKALFGNLNADDYKDILVIVILVIGLQLFGLLLVRLQRYLT